MRKPLEQRFWEKVDKSGDCWLWTSATWGSKGYGFFWVGSKKRSDYAHRVSYLISRGAIPEGRLVMHTCDNPLCVNPAHLELGSIRLNALDAQMKDRIAFGERNGGGGKLSDQAVRKIKFTKGILGCYKTAKIFGVSVNTIKAIRRGEVWRRTPAYLRQALA